MNQWAPVLAARAQRSHDLRDLEVVAGVVTSQRDHAAQYRGDELERSAYGEGSGPADQAGPVTVETGRWGKG